MPSTLFAKTLGCASIVVAVACGPATRAAQSFSFSSGSPDGLMAAASRPESQGSLEIEAADDFILSSETTITSATFTGLVPAGTQLAGVDQVIVEIYRVFPLDSTNPPSGHVPTRTNSPSDVAFAARDSSKNELTFSLALVRAGVTAANSVLNGIHALPDQTTGGEGPVTGDEVTFSVNFTSAFDLPADHYFVVPQVRLTSGQFFWLSAPKPIVAPGTAFTPDLQAWIRNSDLDPDWLRIGTDIVGGTAPPTFNMAFSLTGQVEDATTNTTNGNTNTTTTAPTCGMCGAISPAFFAMFVTGYAGLLVQRRRRRTQRM